MILFLLAGCLGGESYAPGYAYPSFEKTRVRQYCTALYFPPYVEYIAPSRKRKVTSIESRTHGLLAVFADGRSYRVPLQTDLPAFDRKIRRILLHRALQKLREARHGQVC